ncbi:hypothetical protein BCR34DRAFT_101993 [Clohesyomyces aquaticus]|uniref:Zn(2)-C6 fungal-type domain-containing protein n=1 Tax=Clohesyomyces aquaticus TaxID=1231657 RepID=A0A1Y1YSF3_9PLEO|nr:hypothetical protein BCR34DRAFT_101993 [Clohesyomyces aquaticus]
MNCRKRKVRCTGEQPHCQSCLDQKLACAYPQARKDHLKDATDQNNQLLALLRDLILHVDEGGQKRIDELFDSVRVNSFSLTLFDRCCTDVWKLGDETASLQQLQQWGSLGKRSRLGSMTTESSADAPNRRGEADVSGSTGSNENLDLLDEDLLRSRESRATGYVGQNSEV